MVRPGTIAAAAAACALGVLASCGPSAAAEDTSDSSTAAVDSSGGTTVSPPMTTAVDDTLVTTMNPDETTSGSESDTGFGEDTGPDCSFTCPPPPPLPPTGGMCNCPSDEKCMPWANDGGEIFNAIRCSPIAEDAGAPGDACVAEGSQYSGVDNCEEWAMCYGVDPKTNEGVCTSFCSWFGDGACGEEAECQALPGELGVPLCMPTCDPTAPDCGEGMGCFASGSSFLCQAAAEERAPVGSACADPTACVAGALCAFGLDCAQEAGQGCCVEVCDVTEPSPCIGPASCVSWFGGVAGPQWEHVGYCEL